MVHAPGAGRILGADRIDVVRVLLRHHAKPHARSSVGETVLMTALRHAEQEIVNALLEAGAHVGIHETAARGQLDKLTRLLDAAPVLLESRDSYRHAAAVYYAACKNQVTAIDLLINRGANVDAQGKAYGDSNHWAPLIRAGDAQCHKEVRSLLEHGVSASFATLTKIFAHRILRGCGPVVVLWCRSKLRHERSGTNGPPVPERTVSWRLYESRGPHHSVKHHSGCVFAPCTRVW